MVLGAGVGQRPPHVFDEQLLDTLIRLGGKLISVRPPTQLHWDADPTGDPRERAEATVIGDQTGRLKDWFDLHPVGFVIIRPDPYVAAAALAQDTPRVTTALANAVHLTPGDHHDARALLHVAQPATGVVPAGASTRRSQWCRFFINSVAPPFTPIARVRGLGEAVGTYLAGLDKRVLLIGSGGLSHEPPVPTLETAPAHVVEGLIAGRHPTEEATAKRQANVLDAARRFAAGEGNLKALNPDCDNTFLDQLAAGNLEAIDRYTNESIKELGGRSGQEIRN